MTAVTTSPAFTPLYGPGPCLRTERLQAFKNDFQLRRFLLPDMDALLAARLILRNPKDGWRLVTSRPDELVLYVTVRAHDPRYSRTAPIRAIRAATGETTA